MKIRTILYIYATAGLMSCSTVTDEIGSLPHSVQTSGNAVSITDRSAVINARITGNPDEISERGVYWSTEEGFLTDAENGTMEKIAVVTTGNSFNITIDGLLPETVYYAKAFITVGGERMTGNEITFTTTAVPAAGEQPQMDQPVISEITPTSATVSSSVSVVPSGIGERGVCYSTEIEPTVDDSKVADNESGIGEFSVSLSGLTDRTRYYVRGYVYTSAGVVYSDQADFVAELQVKVPKLEFVSENEDEYVTGIDFTTGTVKVRVTDDGGDVPTAIGVRYGTDADNLTKKLAGTPDAEGVVTINLTGLTHNTTYYVKGFAENIKGEGASESTVKFHTAIDGGNGLKYFVMKPIEVTVDGKKVQLEFLDRNLGAKRVAQSIDDYEAYGWMFQWGRRADGHQVVNWKSATEGEFALGMEENSEAPAARNTLDNSPYYKANESGDWLLSPNSGLTDIKSNYYWGAKPEDPLYATGGTNNPCPEGFRVPKAVEWTGITDLAGNATQIFELLDIPAAGYFKVDTSKGAVYTPNVVYLWAGDSGTGKGVTNNKKENYAGFVMFTKGKAVRGMQPATAMSVRCVKIY